MTIKDGKNYITQVRELIIEYTKRLNRDLSFQNLEEELREPAVKYTAPEGELLVAVNDADIVVGMVAYHKHSNDRCEMKRLYVKPETRGMHLGELLVKEIIDRAKQAGYNEMVLDTIAPLKTAIGLYKKYGFEECEPYYDNPMDDVIYMKKYLRQIQVCDTSSETMNKYTIIIGGRSCTVYSASAPKYLLIQPTGEHELSTLDKEIEHIRSLTDMPFVFAACEVTDWNEELSPWNAPPVFGNEPFGSGAGETLAYLEDIFIPDIIKRYSLNEDIPIILGGNSLAGLFAIWSAYTSDRFTAVAGVSPSVWFPGWLDFIEDHSPAVKNIYLSLGRKEEKTRNHTMAAVGDNIRRQHDMLKAMNINATLEWNSGNHFTEPEIRTAKGFAWCINNLTKEDDT